MPMTEQLLDERLRALWACFFFLEQSGAAPHLIEAVNKANDAVRAPHEPA